MVASRTIHPFPRVVKTGILQSKRIPPQAENVRPIVYLNVLCFLYGVLAPLKYDDALHSLAKHVYYRVRIPRGRLSNKLGVQIHLWKSRLAKHTEKGMSG